MDPIRTHASNVCFKLDGGTDENDLWIEKDVDLLDQPVLISTWEPTPGERALIAAGAAIELIVWGEGHPPVAIHVASHLTLHSWRCEGAMPHGFSLLSERYKWRCESCGEIRYESAGAEPTVGACKVVTHDD